MIKIPVTDELRDKVAKLEEIIKLYKDQGGIYSQRISLYELQIEVLKELCGRQDEYEDGH